MEFSRGHKPHWKEVNDLFIMSKERALGLSIAAAILSIFFICIKAWGCFLPFLIITAVIGYWTWTKYDRDQKLAAYSQSSSQPTYTSSAPVPRSTPSSAMTTPGSEKLFVPPPLNG